MHDMWGHMRMWGGGGYWLAGIICVLVVIGLIALIVWALGAAGRKESTGGPTASGPETPLDVLKRRYANGELTDEEFEEKKRRLSQ